ncbi:immunoglobulin superfamily member 8, partial [Sphaeramia orbicularis]|uniref:immunoglobulin superfamily member 8 n=1 Tax=Sphaeramia orbicularis TaxID=375764 RepID=UPI00117D0F16
MEMCSRVLSLLFGLSLFGGCGGRVVTVSPGPLIRVEAQPISIRCDVHDYGGPDEQDFEWRMSTTATGPKTNIISSFDPGYSHASLSQRVASGDISVVRLKDNQVELKIAEVRTQDAGFYECQTPSTDSEIKGNYKAEVQLIVIPHTLKVSPATPPAVVPEGSDITLSCNVTRELSQPTYLSVSWSLKKGSVTEEVLSFGPQGGVTTGSKYARRYADGGIRLVPGKNGAFDLVISRVTMSDDGTYECNGTEWTHESGGTWVKIVESTKEMGTVTVTATAQSLSVTASSSSSSPSSSSVLISPGDTLTLLCSVAVDNLPPMALEVSWLADGRDIITMERSGVVISNTSAAGGGGATVKRGEATLEKTAAGEFRLGVRGVGGADAGAYVCRVRAFIDKGGRSSGGGGRWHMAAEKMSGPVTVTVTQIKPSFTLTLDPVVNPKMAADPTELVCRVSNITHLPLGGRLGVSWLHTPLPGIGVDPQTSNAVGSLDAHGNLLPGSTYSDRLQSGAIALSRVQPDTFKLRFLRTQVRTNRTDFNPLTPDLSVLTLDVCSLTGPKFSVTIQSDASTVYPWETAKMECTLSVSGSSPKTDDLAYEVRWFFTRLRGGESTTQVGGVDRFGVVRKDARNSSSDVSIERKDTHTYTLNIHGTQDSDSGEYHCVSTPWYLSPSTGVWTQAEELTSARIFLTVRFA